MLLFLLIFEEPGDFLAPELDKVHDWLLTATHEFPAERFNHAEQFHRLVPWHSGLTDDVLHHGVV